MATSPSGVGIWQIPLKQGDDLSFPMAWTKDDGSPMDLTGWSMKMMIKAFANSPISLLTLTSTATTGSHIELGGTAGTINLVFAGADTAAIQPIGPPMQNPLALDIPVYKIGVYDLYFVDATGKGGYLIQGSVTLEQQVTTP